MTKRGAVAAVAATAVAALSACGSGEDQAGSTASTAASAPSPTAAQVESSPSASPDVAADQYRNPVFEPILADPSVIRSDDGWFYAFGTEDDWGDGDGRRPVPIVRSPDLVSWEYVGEAFEGGERPDWRAAYLWAPDIQMVGGQFLLYYSLSLWGDANPGIGVATSASPEGPYADRGKLFDSEEIGVENSIDPMLFQDESGLHLFWGSFHGIYGIEMADDGLSTVGAKFQIADEAFEAPYIIERDGAYWFFGSTGSCCEGADSTYAVAVGRADDLRGPYVDADGTELLSGGGTQLLSGDEDFVGPGHNDVIQDVSGTDWLVYHAIDPQQPTAMSGVDRRPLMIDPISWENGWPAVRDGTPSADPRRAPDVTEPDQSEPED